MVTSIVELDIDAPRDLVASLFADPRHSPRWMEDLERYEPISGVPGDEGSTYRLVPKRGWVFVATVLEKSLPEQLRLRLEDSHCSVAISVTFVALADDRTRLVSAETFEFHGLWNTIVGFVAQTAIRRAHRRHMDAFKRFAEREHERTG